MHGGLFSEDDVRIDDIRKLDRNRQPPDSGSWHVVYEYNDLEYRVVCFSAS